MKIIFRDSYALGEEGLFTESHGCGPTALVFLNSAAPSREAAAHTWDPLGVFPDSRWTWLSAKAVFFKISAPPSREAAAHTWDPLGVFTESRGTWLSAKAVFY
jgi:hypothetical protein